MWQSSGKYQPRVDQLVRVAPAIVDMGCFDRVETNGGAFEQVNLLYGENPNVSVRQWTAPLRKAGIQTHMLERGLNALRMNPVPNDVREHTPTSINTKMLAIQAGRTRAKCLPMWEPHHLLKFCMALVSANG